MIDPGFRQAAITEGSFRNQIGLTASTNILIAMIGVGTGIAAARILGPEGRGELAAILLWPMTIGTLAPLGIPEALVYFTAREPRSAGRFLGSSLALGLALSLIAILASYLVLPVLLSAQSTRVLDTARVLLFMIPVLVLGGLPLYLLRGKQEFRAWNLCRVLPALGWIGVLTAAAIGGWGARRVALGYLIITVTLIVPVFAITYPKLGGRVRARVTDWRPLLSFGLPNTLSAIPQMINLRLDQMLIVASLEPTQLGLYTAAIAWSGGLQPILTAIGTILFPRVAAAKTSEERRQTLVSGTAAGTTAALLLGLLVLVATPTVLPLIFGESFRQAVNVALVLVPASAILGLNLILEEGLRGLGAPRFILGAEIAGALTSAISLMFLLPVFGILGAGIASLAGYSATCLALVRSVCRVASVGTADLLRPRWSDLLRAVRSVFVR